MLEAISWLTNIYYTHINIDIKLDNDKDKLNLDSFGQFKGHNSKVFPGIWLVI